MASYRQRDGKWIARVSLGFDASGKRRTVERRFKLKRESEIWAKHQELAPRSSRESIGQTVANLSAEQLAYRKDEGLSGLHLANTKRFHDKWIVPGLGETKLSKVTTRRLWEWSDWMRDEGLSDNQRRKPVQKLKAMFRQAEAEGVISTDPARHLRVPKVPAKAIDRATLPALLSCGDPLVEIAVRIAADTGLAVATFPGCASAASRARRCG